MRLSIWVFLGGLWIGLFFAVGARAHVVVADELLGLLLGVVMALLGGMALRRRRS